jgi:hypothetical protein
MALGERVFVVGVCVREREREICERVRFWGLKNGCLGLFLLCKNKNMKILHICPLYKQSIISHY